MFSLDLIATIIHQVMLLCSLVQVHRSLEATIDAFLTYRFCLSILKLLIDANILYINAENILLQQHFKILASVNFLLLAHFTKEETISKVISTTKITEAESSEQGTHLYLYVYGEAANLLSFSD